MKPFPALVLVFCISQTAWAAGGMISGGGASIVCRDEKKQIVRAELLDLFEGRVRFQYVIPSVNDAVDTQINTAVNRWNFDSHGQADLIFILSDLITKYEFFPHGVVIFPGMDLGSDRAILVPDGCSVEYAAYYESDRVLRIAQPIFQKLSKTDQAALFIHEAIYKMARAKDIPDSASSRQLTAGLFASNTSQKQLEDLNSTPNGPIIGRKLSDFNVPPVYLDASQGASIDLEIAGAATSTSYHYFLSSIAEPGSIPGPGKGYEYTAITLPYRLANIFTPRHTYLFLEQEIQKPRPAVTVTLKQQGRIVWERLTSDMIMLNIFWKTSLAKLGY